MFLTLLTLIPCFDLTKYVDNHKTPMEKYNVDVGFYQIVVCFIQLFQHQEALDWSTLKSEVADAAGQTIQYGIIEGTVRSLGGSLKSQFTDVEGPVKRFKRTLMKSERHRGYW